MKFNTFFVAFDSGGTPLSWNTNGSGEEPFVLASLPEWVIEELGRQGWEYKGAFPFKLPLPQPPPEGSITLVFQKPAEGLEKL